MKTLLKILTLWEVNRIRTRLGYRAIYRFIKGNEFISPVQASIPGRCQLVRLEQDLLLHHLEGPILEQVRLYRQGFWIGNNLVLLPVFVMWFNDLYWDHKYPSLMEHIYSVNPDDVKAIQEAA